MIPLSDCVTGGDVSRLIPVTANSNKEQPAASILLAAFWDMHEFHQTKINSLGIRVGKKAKVEVVFVLVAEPKWHFQEYERSVYINTDIPNGGLVDRYERIPSLTFFL